MNISESPVKPGYTVRQARSQKTYEKLVATGFDLLEKNEIEAITIAGLAEAAGYSVGAFYARFKSKDEFLEAMVAQHLQTRYRARDQLLQKVSRDELVSDWITGLVRYYWQNRRFWRAALLRSVTDPDFWAPIDRNGREFVSAFTARIAADAGRPLTAGESENVRFAIHMVLSTVNNRIVNRPRPSLIGRSTFIRNLIRAFYLISDYDALARPSSGS